MQFATIAAILAATMTAVALPAAPAQINNLEARAAPSCQAHAGSGKGKLVCCSQASILGLLGCVFNICSTGDNAYAAALLTTINRYASFINIEASCINADLVL
ncbi:hypothetical protein OQA88_11256 [Cercophora sp. LCS_1]